MADELVYPPNVPLARALDQSELVREKVEECATELSSVNTVLKQELAEGVPLEGVERALAQSEGVEVKVQECVDDLATVNDALAEEIDERRLLEHQLSASNAALIESRVQERKAHHRALHDVATGLPNMALFNDRLDSALVQAKRHAWRLAVMFIDLDDFKLVNDSFGHDAGDQVLRGVALRLERFVRGGDTLSRRSGDEFLLLMLEAKDEDAVASFAAKIGENIAAACDVDGVKITVRASIGIAIYPEDGMSPQELLKNADTAMYAAKQQRTGTMLYSTIVPR
ncbi:MAG: GGDEF domain-containing protein [Gemmatimonadota bacterium]